MDTVRFGIVGVGNMGTGHIKKFFEGKIQNAVVTAVCDVKQERLDAIREVCGDNVEYFLDYHDLLKCDAVDVVMIATPHYLHPVIGIEAFEAGKHVLSEKPIGVYTKKVEELMEAARKSGKVFGVMYNQRTNPAYQMMRQIVQSGELGSLKRCVWIITDWYRTQAYYNSGGWRATWEGEGGGVLLNQCPHNLDLWQWIFGMPNRIRAFCSFGKYHDIEVDDDVTAYAEYPNGATGVFITSTAESPGTNRLEITGSKGKLVYEANVLTYTKLEEDERVYCFETTDSFKKVPSTTETITFEGRGTGHVGIFQNFTNHLLNGEPLLAPGYEGINGLSISNAMMLSTWTNNFVDLPNDGTEFLSYLEDKIKNSTLKKEDVAGGVSNLDGTY
ncbi:MAG: Gfo/Idh/MocA family oxidoreductase [Clostridia bacterium]|nr:Gfo/Idh/MocA family oxidoreductase [Clostridia bacterium]